MKPVADADAEATVLGSATGVPVTIGAAPRLRADQRGSRLARPGGVILANPFQ